jgi:O-antigen ligase
MLLVYLMRVDIRIYAIEKAIAESQKGESSLADYGAFDSLRLGWFCGMNYVCNLFVKDKWTHSKQVNTIVFWAITVFTLTICIATIQRGPILFVITTSLFYAYAKGFFKFKNAGIAIPLIILFVIFATTIYNQLYLIFPELMERFEGTIERGGTGRFGSEDSAYNLAFKEFLLNPLFGHYFRYTETHGYFYGLYPHNILLESLMTMGLVFSIPFFVVLWKCVKNTYYAIKYDAPVAVFGLIFIYIFSTLMTSASMILMNSFWIPLAVISVYTPVANKKRISNEGDK